MVVRELVTLIGFRVDDAALRAAERRIQTFSKNLQRVGRRLTMTVTAPIVGLGIGILKAAGDFEFAMNRVRVLTDATGSDFEKLKQQAKDLGRTTVFSASDAAEGMGFLAQAGFKTNEIYAAMPATLNLAAASQQDLATTADQLSNIMQGFRLPAEQAGRAADTLAYAASNSNTNVSQLAEAMKYAAPMAQLVGMTLEETAAMMGFMGNAGIQASMAGTTLRQAIVHLLDPAGKAMGAFKELGISLYTVDRNGKKARKPLYDMLEELEKMGLSSDELATALTKIFGQRAVSGMAAIIGQGTDSLREFNAEIGKKGLGTAARQAEIQMEGFRGAMKRLRSTAEASAIAIAESGFMEWVEKLVQKFADFFENLSKTNPELLRMGTVAALAAAGLGPLLYLVGGLGLALTAISAHPIILVIAALTTLFALWKYFQTETGKKKAEDLIGKLQKSKFIGMIKHRTERELAREGYAKVAGGYTYMEGSPEYQRIYAEQMQRYYEGLESGREIQRFPYYEKMVGTGNEISVHQSNEIHVSLAEGIEVSKITEMVSAAMDATVQQITDDIERNIVNQE